MNISRYLILLTLTLTAVSNSAEIPKPIPVAVLGFDSVDQDDAEGDAVSALLTAELSGEDSILLVEREDLARILNESEMTLSGAVSGEAAPRIGQLTGAKAIITGRLFNAGGKSFLVGKCIGTETGRVFAHSIEREAGASYTESVRELATEFRGVLQTKQNELLAKVETPEERIARLGKLIEGKMLAPVHVAISEEHLSRRVPDPAVQVEIQKTLQDLGFPLAKSPGPGVRSITGEAFSELAGRQGNLVACRARVEIRISTGEENNEIKVDRETSVALDLAENIAAKSALQNAGSSLAERILPFITEE